MPEPASEAAIDPEDQMRMDGAKATFKDYYYILGVNPEATSEEIREAYQELYDRFGPHVNIGGQDPEAMLKAFKEISEAYEVLMDANRRKEYDRANLPHLQKTHLRQLWGKVSGSNGQQPQPAAGEETRSECEITLREAVKGTIVKVRVDENLPCTGCANLKPVQRMQCSNCRGSGSIHNARQEEVEIPPGAWDRMQVRRAGKGKLDARTNRYGDLVVFVKIRPHSYFSVMGRDLTCTVPVTFLEAILGGEIEVPTATGKVIMKIQPLTQSGRVYRLKGLGLGGADLLATIDVVVPKQISAEEVELFRKLKSVSTLSNPRDEILQMLANNAGDT